MQSLKNFIVTSPLVLIASITSVAVAAGTPHPSEALRSQFPPHFFRPWSLAKLLLHPAGPALLDNLAVQASRRDLAPIGRMNGQVTYNNLKSLGLLGMVKYGRRFLEIRPQSPILGLARERLDLYFYLITKLFPADFDAHGMAEFGEYQLLDNKRWGLRQVKARGWTNVKVGRLEARLISYHPELRFDSPFCDADLFGLQLGGAGIFAVTAVTDDDDHMRNMFPHDVWRMIPHQQTVVERLRDQALFPDRNELVMYENDAAILGLPSPGRADVVRLNNLIVFLDQRLAGLMTQIFGSDCQVNLSSRRRTKNLRHKRTLPF